MTYFLSRDRSRPLQSSRLIETSRCIRGAEWGWLRSTSHVEFVTRDFMDRSLRLSNCALCTTSRRTYRKRHGRASTRGSVWKCREHSPRNFADCVANHLARLTHGNVKPTWNRAREHSVAVNTKISHASAKKKYDRGRLASANPVWSSAHSERAVSTRHRVASLPASPCVPRTHRITMPHPETSIHNLPNSNATLNVCWTRVQIQSRNAHRDYDKRRRVHAAVAQQLLVFFVRHLSTARSTL